MATDRFSLLLYRVLFLSTAVVALVAGFTAGLGAVEISPAHQLTEYWRAYGLLVFAMLFAWLAATPPGAAVLWVVVLFHKASMTLTAVLLLRHGAEGAAQAALVDGAMVAVVLIALALRRAAARAAERDRRSGHLVVVGDDPDPDGRGHGHTDLYRPLAEIDPDDAQLDLSGPHGERRIGS